MFCRQDTRHGWCIVIPSYIYNGMESGDSRLCICTKMAVSFEDSNLNHQTLQKQPWWQNQNERMIHSWTLYSFVTNPKTLQHYLQPPYTPSLSFKVNVWSIWICLTKSLWHFVIFKDIYEHFRYKTNLLNWPVAMLSLSQIFMFFTLGKAGRSLATCIINHNESANTGSPICQHRHVWDCKNCTRHDDGHRYGCPRIHPIN